MKVAFRANEVLDITPEMVSAYAESLGFRSTGVKFLHTDGRGMVFPHSPSAMVLCINGLAYHLGKTNYELAAEIVAAYAPKAPEPVIPSPQEPAKPEKPKAKMGRKPKRKRVAS